MNESQLLKAIGNLKAQVRRDIQTGLRLISSEVKNIILEREQKIADRLASHDNRATRYEEQLRNTNSKLRKVWQVVEEMKKNDARQNEELAANRTTEEKLNQTRRIWLMAISTLCTVGGFVVGLVVT